VPLLVGGPRDELLGVQHDELPDELLGVQHDELPDELPDELLGVQHDELPDELLGVQHDELPDELLGVRPDELLDVQHDIPVLVPFHVVVNVPLDPPPMREAASVGAATGGCPTTRSVRMAADATTSPPMRCFGGFMIAPVQKIALIKAAPYKSHS
jgi:hypothetical protein